MNAPFGLRKHIVKGTPVEVKPQPSVAVAHSAFQRPIRFTKAGRPTKSDGLTQHQRVVMNRARKSIGAM